MAKRAINPLDKIVDDGNEPANSNTGFAVVDEGTTGSDEITFTELDAAELERKQTERRDRKRAEQIGRKERELRAEIEKPAARKTEGKRKSAKAENNPDIASVTTNVSGLERLLLSAHTMLASITKNPILAITPEEAKGLADAVARVNAAYAIALTEKQEAVGNLIMMAGAIYSPRLMAMRNIRAAMKKPSPATPTPNGNAQTAPMQNDAVSDYLSKNGFGRG